MSNLDVVDLDLELDLNININPMWPENDFLANANANVTDLTDAILADELSFADTINNDITWNTVQGLENFYYEDVDEPKPNSIMESWPGTDANTCSNSMDVLKDSLFELEIFSDCLNVDGPSISTPVDIETVSSSPADADPIVEWNRRRSLLYDKNEFVKSAPDGNHSHEPRAKPKSKCHSNVSVDDVDQRTFRCSVRDCDKTYHKASHLKSHMRRHSGVKPFACDWDGCKWRFSRSDELSRHKRSHSGIKPYSCDLCDKAFSRSDHLSKHAKVHMKKMALYGTPIITKKCNYKYLTVNRIPVE